MKMNHNIIYGKENQLIFWRYYPCKKKYMIILIKFITTWKK